ncbi:MAG TPA: transketolase [Planctomycetes bacterium]|nr:transketolase [Planctomycetota bacterium]
MSQAAALDSLCVNTIRTLSIDAIEKANSGHPGLPLGAAPAAYTLWQHHLKVAPSQPDWIDRDRFVLSAGHGSALLYSLLHLYGFGLPLPELRNFRQWNALTPGHPEFGHTPGVDATTGPLGQGFANAVGMAMAERFLAGRYNRPGHQVIDHHTFVLCGDGDLMEGISSEAASLAGHLGLGKLVVLYDSNDISLDGPCSLTFSENIRSRFEAVGWQVLRVADGDHDLEAIGAAIESAKTTLDRPTLIEVKTTIGFGSPNKAGTAASHGAPLGPDEVRATKEALGWEAAEPFHVPAEARERFREAQIAGTQAFHAWQERYDAWKKAFPDLAAEFETALRGELPEGWDAELPEFEAGKSVATRASSGKILNALAKRVPWLLGGDADLSCSTKTALVGEDSFDGASGHGRNIHYGVREHAMGAAANGIAYHGGARTFCSTFFVFSDYMRPTIRMAAMAGLPVSFVFTHDSVAVGEDGPTHQPVEHLASLRAMPGVLVMRPCDAAETEAAWRRMIQEKVRPTALILSRQGVPTLDRTELAAADNLERGGYVLSEAQDGKPRAILIATGAEVHLALQAQRELAAQGIGVRVVSMPCVELFEEQDSDWQDSVLPPELEARVSIEAGSTMGWARFVGRGGISIGIDRFGASAPGNVVLEELGFTTDRIVRTVRTLLGAEALR